MQDKIIKILVFAVFVLWLLDIEFSAISPLDITSAVLWVVIAILAVLSLKKR